MVEIMFAVAVLNCLTTLSGSVEPIFRNLNEVFSGGLCLIMFEPVSLEQAEGDIEEWERLAVQAPSGLIGFTQPQLPAYASAEAHLLNNPLFARHHGLGEHWLCLWEGFLFQFSCRTWSSKE